MPMATIHKVGTGELYHIHFLDQRTDPGYGQGGGFHPDQDLPGRSPRPDQGLPGYGHPDQGLPGTGAHPGNRPPGSGNPAFPDNSLPEGPLPPVAPGATLVLIRSGDGKWHYAAIQPGSPPPRPLPSPPYPSGQPVPGGGPRPDNTLPPAATPKA